MKNVLTNRWADFHNYATYLLFFALPFPDRYLPLTIVLWMVTWLLYRIFDKSDGVTRLPHYTRIGVFLLLAWSILGIISIFFTDDIAQNIRHIDRRLALILVPLVLLLGESKWVKNDKVVDAYLLGSLMSIAVYFFIFSFEYLFFDPGNLRFQLDRAVIVDYISDFKHPAYFSLNIVVALYLFVHRSFLRYRRITFSTLIADLAIGTAIFIIQSRIGLVLFLLANFLLLWQFMRMRLTMIKTLFAIVALFVLLLIVFTAISPKEGNPFQLEEDERTLLWQSSIELIKEKPLLGYGLGGSELFFVESAYVAGVDSARERMINAHNQFLQSTLDNGLVGILLLFTALSFIVFDRSDNEKFRTKLFVLLFIAVAFFTESMLQRIAGVGSFAFLVYLISLHDSKERSRSYTSDSRLFVSCSLLSFISILLFVFSMWYDAARVINPYNARSYAIDNHTIVKSRDLPLVLPDSLVFMNINAVMYDNTTLGWHRDSMVYRHIPIIKADVNRGDTIRFSAYCYLSDDFDGAWSRISIEGENKASDYYDINNKGTWQLLEIQIVCKVSEELMLCLFFSDDYIETFTSMNGFVLFTLPRYDISVSSATLDSL